MTRADDAQSGVLVGGFNPDEIFNQKAAEVQKRRKTYLEDTLAGATAARDSRGPQDDGQQAGNNPPPATIPPQSGDQFSITDEILSYIIRGVRYHGETYTVQLNKDILISGPQMRQDEWAAWTVDAIKNNAHLHYVASAPFYMALFSHLASNKDSVDPSCPRLVDRKLVGDVQSKLKKTLEENVLMTLTDLTYNPQQNQRDVASDNRETPWLYAGRWVQAPAGASVLFSQGSPPGKLCEDLLEITYPHLVKVVEWLRGGTAVESIFSPLETRPVLGPVTMPVRIYLTSSLRTNPAFHVVADIDNTAGAIGVRIIDKHGKAVLP